MRKGAVVLLLIALAQPVAAQEPLAALWSRLEAASSVNELHTVAVPAGADEDVAHALVQLRRYELGRNRTDALTGRSVLERVTPRATSAWAHFALGVSLARGPDVRIVLGDDPDVYVVTPHSNAAKQAPRALKRALQLDPTLDEAVWALAELALDLGDRALLRDALPWLNAPGRARSPHALELRSRVLAQLGEVQAAAEAADLLQSAGGDASLAAHLKAAALLRRRGSESEGARAYLEGAASLTEASARAYFEGLVALVSAAELERWEAADLAGRGEWLRRFWDVHAALAGVTVEERLAEHYRRLATVWSRGRVAPMGAGGETYGGRQVPDTRALGVASLSHLLLLRHGDPVRDRRVRYCGREVLDMPLALAPGPAQCARSPISRMREQNAAFVGATALKVGRAIDAAVTGTSHYPRFHRHLEFVHELHQFRGPAGHTLVVAAVGLPASAARQFVAAGVLTTRLELSLIDTAQAVVVRHDTLYRFRADHLPEPGWALVATELTVSARTAQLYRLGAMDEARSAGGVVGGTLDVRDHESAGLLLSDVVLAPEGGVPGFARGDVRLSLAPGVEFRPDERFTLYYEVYGLERGAAYRTEIILEPKPNGLAERLRALFPGARESVRISFSETVTAAHEVYGVQQTRSVGLDHILPGTYVVRVTVTDEQGRSAQRERSLHVGHAR